MALTQEEKRKKRGKSSLKKWIFILIGVILLIGVGYFIFSSQRSSESMDEVSLEKGSFTSTEGVSYTYEIQKGDGEYAVSFTPNLPDTDKALSDVVVYLLGRIYGDQVTLNEDAKIVEKDGRKVIRFLSNDGTYFVFPVKQKSGEIHTLVFWKE